MKKKVTSVVLTVLVIAVWGLIAIRIWSYLKPHTVQTAVDDVREVVRQECEDTLVLDYRDPFLERRAEMEKNIGLENDSIEPTQFSIPVSPQFNYKGRVKGIGGVVLAILDADGEMILVQKGESFEGSVIVEIDPSFVILDNDGTKMKIDIQ